MSQEETCVDTVGGQIQIEFKSVFSAKMSKVNITE